MCCKTCRGRSEEMRLVQKMFLFSLFRVSTTAKSTTRQRAVGKKKQTRQKGREKRESSGMYLYRSFLRTMCTMYFLRYIRLYNEPARVPEGRDSRRRWKDKGGKL